MKIQVGLDDLCPRPTQSFEQWSNAEKLLDRGLKVDLFIPFALSRDGEEAYHIIDYPEFLDRMEAISALPGVRLNVHGFHHGWGNDNNGEFYHGDTDTLKHRLDQIDKDIERTGLSFHRVFRPPAWRISQGAVDSIIEFGYTHLSIMSGTAYLEYDHLDFKDLKLHWCNAAPPYMGLPKDDISVTYHMCTWLDNGLTNNNTNELLDHIGTNRIEAYWVSEI